MLVKITKYSVISLDINFFHSFKGVGMSVGYSTGQFPQPIGSGHDDFNYDYMHAKMGYKMSTDPLECQETNVTAYFETLSSKNPRT